ncbi:MAG: hypothetical protein IJ003_00420 [Candidatus Gastranaerophilales bacterium]|nr:hypothetical protein [Candidatus Gastranaerophilales bacterium]
MQIKKLIPVNRINFKQQTSVASLSSKNDCCEFENSNVNKKVFIDRRIINPDKNINAFFDEISEKVFHNNEDKKYFSTMLKEGFISLSSACYLNLEHPSSATAVKLNPNNSITKNLAYLEGFINSENGIGINFQDFENPIEQIKKINAYLKYRQETTNRPPAAIGLLNITHPMILDFIGLKDDEDYKNWCFDISVIIPDDFLEKVDNNEDVILDNGQKIKAREIYLKLITSMQKKGEPGVIFSNKKDYNCDCCAASELNENEKLVLGHINLAKFYDTKTEKIDYAKLQKCADILSKAMSNIDENSRIGILGYATLLDKMDIQYGSKEAIKLLDKVLSIIKAKVKANNLKMAISPTGTISRFLMVSPALEPINNEKITYYQELDTMICAQKYLDGNISKTILLKNYHTKEDIDCIIRYCAKNNIKGISVFPRN